MAETTQTVVQIRTTERVLSVTSLDLSIENQRITWSYTHILNLFLSFVLHAIPTPSRAGSASHLLHYPSERRRREMNRTDCFDRTSILSIGSDILGILTEHLNSVPNQSLRKERIGVDEYFTGGICSSDLHPNLISMSGDHHSRFRIFIISSIPNNSCISLEGNFFPIRFRYLCESFR